MRSILNEIGLESTHAVTRMAAKPASDGRLTLPAGLLNHLDFTSPVWDTKKFPSVALLGIYNIREDEKNQCRSLFGL
jgi:hypothetical protein